MQFIDIHATDILFIASKSYSGYNKVIVSYSPTLRLKFCVISVSVYSMQLLLLLLLFSARIASFSSPPSRVSAPF